MHPRPGKMHLPQRQLPQAPHLVNWLRNASFALHQPSPKSSTSLQWDLPIHSHAEHPQIESHQKMLRYLPDVLFPKSFPHLRFGRLPQAALQKPPLPSGHQRHGWIESLPYPNRQLSPSASSLLHPRFSAKCPQSHLPSRPDPKWGISLSKRLSPEFERSSMLELGQNLP